MATFDISPLYRSSSVGIDRGWESPRTTLHLDAAGYPAYNILRIDDDEYRISLAVPGYSRSEISIETREGTVWVKGEPSTDPNHNQYLFRGFTLPAFQRTFQLPQYTRVKTARLDAGLLHIELVRELPEALRPQRIEVTSAAPESSLLEEASRAA